MMKLTSRVAFGSLLTTTVAAVALALPGAAQAAQPGQVCLTNTDTVLIWTGGGFFIPAGSGFRIDAYAPNGYVGHGGGSPKGWISPRSVINQSTCTW